MADKIRTLHRYGFRCDEWADLVGTVDHGATNRRCYVVRFPDGTSDFWVVDDPDAQYEIVPEEAVS